MSFVPDGVVFVSSLPAVSTMSWPEAKLSAAVASRLARSPPSAFTSKTVDAVTSLTVSAAVVPLTVKSAAFTFATFSLNITRQVRLSALVGDDNGVWRTIDITVGAVESNTDEACSAAVLPLPAASVAAFAATSNVTAPSAVGVISAV